MTLRYPYELREAKDYFYDIPDMKVEPELLALAQHILRTKEAKVRPDKIRGSIRAGRRRDAATEAGRAAGDGEDVSAALSRTRPDGSVPQEPGGRAGRNRER
jgi:DNA end-binding protein Ku